jgi:O-6-methylguanine DNA methyltransferase
MGTLYTTKIDSPIGRLTIASSDDGLAYLGLPRANGRGFAGWCERQAPDDVIQSAFEPNREAYSQIDAYLNGKRQDFDLALDLRGTEFQLLVYRAVGAIPYGATLSYADVAEAVGRPTAVRAVGAANGANPIPIVIPCHRVIATSGQLQGYAGGLKLKSRLLVMENATSDLAEGLLL